MEERWGEEGPPLSSVLSPLLRRGERKKETRAPQNLRGLRRFWEILIE
jgi:hypothetical protein